MNSDFPWPFLASLCHVCWLSSMHGCRCLPVRCLHDVLRWPKLHEIVKMSKSVKITKITKIVRKWFLTLTTYRVVLSYTLIFWYFCITFSTIMPLRMFFNRPEWHIWAYDMVMRGPSMTKIARDGTYVEIAQNRSELRKSPIFLKTTLFWEISQMSRWAIRVWKIWKISKMAKITFFSSKQRYK